MHLPMLARRSSTFENLLERCVSAIHLFRLFERFSFHLPLYHLPSYDLLIYYSGSSGPDSNELIFSI